MIDDGVAFYRKIASVIKKGFTTRYGTEISSYRHPKGWQGILRTGEDGKAFALFHGFYEAAGMEVSVPVPEGYRISEVYSYENEQVWLADGKLYLQLKEDMKAAAEAHFGNSAQ